MTLSGFMDSVMELVCFVGRLASAGLQLEGCHSLLLSYVLDFYQTVASLEPRDSLHLAWQQGPTKSSSSNIKRTVYSGQLAEVLLFPRVRACARPSPLPLLQVCDMFLKYSLPLVVLPPSGVFYPALLATDPVSVDRLAHIMVR